MFSFLGASEFIKRKERYILVLKNISPSEIKQMPAVYERVERVKEYRSSSKSKPTQKLAQTPTLFHTENLPKSPYLVIPEVTSMRRVYIPIGYLDSSIVSSNKLRIIQSDDLYLFGILTSLMHMSWMRKISGRLKSDYSYSVKGVYNNYPFPLEVTNSEKEKVRMAAKKVLSVRDTFPNSSYADLYDPLSMPPALLKAHQTLDRVVDKCYRKKNFSNERERIEFLFELYEVYTAPLLKSK